jgi:protocatechuate 3,4-dioxygenase beta subunit
VEPGREPYWVDQIVFAGEFKVDRQYHASQALVGGSGIIKLAPNEAGVLTGVRDIRLGNARGTLA